MKAKSILETLGRTPIVEVSKKLNGTSAKVFVKVESFNPGGSAKDRVAVAMIEAAHGTFDTHEYLHSVKTRPDSDFSEQCAEWHKRFEIKYDI